MTGDPTIARLPACAEDSLCVVDGMTGSRAATMAMLQDGGLFGLEPPPTMLAAQSGTMAAPGVGGSGGTALPRGAVRIRGRLLLPAQVMQWIHDEGERRQVEAALSRFSLDRNSAADLLAGRSYVWAQNMLPGNLRYWNKVPFSGPVNLRVAEAVMRHERANPGFALLAVEGDAAALRTLDSIVNAATAAVPQGPTTVVRTSAVSPALSADSTRARTLLGILGSQWWQAHHIIPFAVMARLPAPVQRAIAASGWRMDSLVNLIALPANMITYLMPPNLGQLPYHSGSHGVRYDPDVWNALQLIAATAALTTPVALKAAVDGVDVRFRLALRTNALYKPRLN